MTTFFSVDVETSGLTPATGYLLTVGIKPVAWDGSRWDLLDGSMYVLRPAYVVLGLLDGPASLPELLYPKAQKVEK